MPLTTPIYLVDSPSHSQWLVTCDNNAILETVPVSGQNAVPYTRVNSVTDGTSWQISVVGNPPPTGFNWGDLRATSITQDSYPTQLLVTAPNGTVYAIQVATVGPPILGTIAQGIIQTALPLAPYNCNTPISTLAQNVLSRLEDPSSVFWSTEFEVNAGIVEALNETILLVGRPAQTVGLQFNLTPNTPWQFVPKGVMSVTDIWGPQSRLRRGTLFDLDYSQSSWGSDWENDTDPAGPTMFVPLGFNMFVVHPATSVPQTVLLDGIAYPVTVPYPYDGSQIVPFEDHFFEMFEMYSAVYCRLKESGAELQEAMPMLQNFYKLAERMTTIQDRRDPMVFSPSFGGTIGVNALKRR